MSLFSCDCELSFNLFSHKPIANLDVFYTGSVKIYVLELGL